MRSVGPLKTPDQVLGTIWGKIPGYIKLTFIASMVLGLCTHLYMFTNKLINFDDILALFDATYGTASGRWLLPTVLRWDGNYSMPWLIGLLSILCLSVTACLTVALFRIRRPVGCIVTAALLMAFPTVAATFSYMFSADAYFFSMMLAAFGAYAAVRFPRVGIPLGIVCILFSMGIYQSYFPVAAVMMVGAMLFEILDGDKSFRDILWKGLRLILILAVAMGGYFILTRFATRDVGLVDYMGISTMGQLPLSQLPSLIVQCYTKYMDFFLFNQQGFHFHFLKYLFLLTGLGAVVLFVLLLWQRKLGVLRTILAVVLALLFPLAGNLIYIMTAGGMVHELMIYGSAFLLVAPIALAEYAGEHLEFHTLASQLLHPLLCWVILGSMALTAYNYIVTDNKAYLKMDISYEQCFAYSNRLLQAIESTEGYDRGMPIALVGSGVWDEALSPTPQLNDIAMGGVANFGLLRTGYTYDIYLHYYLGFINSIYLDESDLVQELAVREDVIAMPCYPQAGSIQVIDGIMVVKLNPINALPE